MTASLLLHYYASHKGNSISKLVSLKLSTKVYEPHFYHISVAYKELRAKKKLFSLCYVKLKQEFCGRLNVWSLIVYYKFPSYIWNGSASLTWEQLFSLLGSVWQLEFVVSFLRMLWPRLYICGPVIKRMMIYSLIGHRILGVRATFLRWVKETVRVGKKRRAC